MAVDDRRHDCIDYLAVALSVTDQLYEVSKRVEPGTPIPSVQWLRLQFWPKTPSAKTALQYIGTKVHGTSALLSHQSNNNPMMFIYTDGGPDYHVKYHSEQLTFICLFLLVAVQTPPYNSWKIQQNR